MSVDTKLPETIRHLIEQTEGTKERAELLILLQISESLVENTTLTKTLSTDFNAHAIREENLIAQGRLGVRLVVGFIAVLQIMLAFGVKKLDSEFESYKTKVDKLVVEMAQHMEHHEQEEKYRGGPSIRQSLMDYKLVRELFSPEIDGKQGYTLGTIYDDGFIAGYTLEDEDRMLENGGEKVYGKTAIPRGRYELVLYDSPKHGTVPLLRNVPGFEYVEIHGANHAEELLGCIAVGTFRTNDGVYDCKVVIKRIVNRLKLEEAAGNRSYLEVI